MLQVCHRTGTCRQVFADGETLVYAKRVGKPLVLLAGHLDTVPAQGNLPGRLEDGGVDGLGASDMKGGLAVMIELARWAAAADLAYDVAFLFFPREELGPSENPLPALRGGAACRRGGAGDLPRADRQHAAAGLPRQPQRAGRLRGTVGPLRPAVARRECDRRRVRGAAGRPPARAARRGDRRPAVPGGALGHADPRRDRDERDPGPRRGDPELPLRTRPHAGRGGGPRARAGRLPGRDPSNSPAAHVALGSPVVDALRAGRRPRGAAEAGLDERCRLRSARSRRRQLRSRRDALRARGRRAGRGFCSSSAPSTSFSGSCSVPSRRCQSSSHLCSPSSRSIRLRGWTTGRPMPGRAASSSSISAWATRGRSHRPSSGRRCSPRSTRSRATRGRLGYPSCGAPWRVDRSPLRGRGRSRDGDRADAGLEGGDLLVRSDRGRREEARRDPRAGLPGLRARCAFCGSGRRDGAAHRGARLASGSRRV